MPSWLQLAHLPNRELARIDIALMNLECGHGLPGCDCNDLGKSLQVIDNWALETLHFTNRVMPQFYSRRCDYPDSEPRFRIQAMITHLQRDLGLRFRPEKKSNHAVLEPADTFLQGILQGKGGTCGSLPVLYAAVGRRLGYPLMLANTRNHLFVRWDALPGGERFNIEASGDGVSFFADEYYRTGHYQMPPQTIAACGYLQSLSPREELAGFLCQRGECWMQEQNYGEAAFSYAYANELDPRRLQHGMLLENAMQKWHQKLLVILPPTGFPILDIGFPAPYFHQLPRELERRLMWLRVFENVLRDPELDRRWWLPLRLGRKVTGIPAKIYRDHIWTFSDRATALDF